MNDRAFGHYDGHCHRTTAVRDKKIPTRKELAQAAEYTPQRVMTQWAALLSEVAGRKSHRRRS